MLPNVMLQMLPNASESFRILPNASECTHVSLSIKSYNINSFCNSTKYFNIFFLCYIYMSDIKKLFHNIKFKEFLIKRINDAVDIPLVIEEHEAIIIESLLNILFEGINNFDDNYVKFMKSYFC
jgi:hypothetical protein